MRLLLSAALLAALAACNRQPPASEAPATPAPAAQTPASPAPSAPAPAAPPTQARFDGYGDLRFGMTPDEASTAWQGELLGGPVKATDCTYLRPKWADGTAQFGFMFEGGKLVRYDIGTDRETAPGGGRVGMTRGQIEELYAGRVEVQPHEYVPEGKTMRVADRDDRTRAIVFETDAAGRVTSWRAGVAPQVDYVEGCS